MVVRNSIQFILLILFQLFIFNRIDFGGFVNPYPYILFTILLPFDIKGMLLLFTSFILGLTLDVFSLTLGINAAACTLVAFLRPTILRLIFNRTDDLQKNQPSIASMGTYKFFIYSYVMVFIHHLCVFSMEIFRFNEFWEIIGRTFMSSIFTIIIVFIYQYLFTSRKVGRVYIR